MKTIEQMEFNLLATVRTQETFMLSLRGRIISRGTTLESSKSWSLERSKMLGMLDMLDSCKIDRTEFNWVI